MIRIFNKDCMEFMKDMPDDYYNLAIVDPMYDLPDNYLCPGSNISSNGIKRKNVNKAKQLAKLDIVAYEYYNELKRVSKNQIIWGINYFPFAHEIKGRIVWDKKNDSSTFSNCELAACSLFDGVRIFRYLWNGMLQENMKNKENRIHPFQKPVDLYKWLIEKYAKSGDKILDTHGGSMSSVIACIDLGFEIDCCELDKDNFNEARKRIEWHSRQLNMFQEKQEIYFN